jgi:hypothetical protein
VPYGSALVAYPPVQSQAAPLEPPSTLDDSNRSVRGFQAERNPLLDGDNLSNV